MFRSVGAGGCDAPGDPPTPFDREEEETPGGIECIFIGRVRTAVVGVEYLPVLEVSDKSLDWRPE